MILAVDPGRAKCGLAVVRAADPQPLVLHREIIEPNRVVARVLPLLGRYGVEAVLVGDATGGAPLLHALQDALPTRVPVHAVDEAFSSQRARQRFARDHPPRGWARLIPPGFRTPPHAYDDYVAVILAEDYFAAGS